MDCSLIGIGKNMGKIQKNNKREGAHLKDTWKPVYIAVFWVLVQSLI